MKLQSASIKEIKRIALGSVICLALMIAAFFLLSQFGIGSFDYRVILSGVIGTLVAVGNFTLLCITIQKAAAMEDKKQMKARFQVSYNARLIIQAAWVVVAFLVSWLNALAAAIPLLFPTVIIYYLQIKGRLVSPSERKNPPQMEQEEDRPDTFDI